MTTHIYFGTLLSPEDEKAVLIDHDTPRAFNALLGGVPVRGAGGPCGVAPWVGVPASGLPCRPLPLAYATNLVFRHDETPKRWSAYREFVKRTIGVDLGEGVLFLLCVDTDED